MNKTIRILIPIILTVAIILSCGWYLFSYDQLFTRDALMCVARFFENQGYHSTSTWFYNIAYSQIGDNDNVAIELAQQYKKIGNYTKAEYTLRKAITDGASAELYIALCKTFVEQDKLLDAVNMLNNITDPAVKEQLDVQRPATPTSSHSSGQYNQFITVEFSADSGTLFVSGDGEYPSTAKDRYTAPMALTEGENNMYAISVAENGLVSPLAVYGYTIGGIIRPVTFTDPVIEASIRDIIAIDAPEVVYTNDLWQIKEFTVPAKAKKYEDVALLSYVEKLIAENAIAAEIHHFMGLSELTELSISGSSVSSEHLASMARLPKLRSLTLSDCDISSVANLAGAAALEYLDLNNNAIRDIQALSSIVTLKEINLSHNAVDNLDALYPLTALEKLDVSYNALTALDSLTGLTRLSQIIADHNAISQFSALPGLTYLSLSANKLTSVSAISQCAELTELYIAENQLTDIGALSKLNKLMYLDFSNNKVTSIPTWSKSCALVTINGSRNSIKSVAALSGLKSLNTVNMDYNKNISSVKELADCPILVQVNVYGTKVKEVGDLTSKNIIVNYNPV